MADLNRRDAFKSLAAFAGAAGITVTPVTTQNTQGLEGVLLKVNGHVSADMVIRLRQMWEQAWKGTALEGTPAVILDEGIEVEFVRTHG